MARIPRKLTVQAGLSVHKVWRGHNKEWNLGTAPQKERYLEFMNEDLESKKYEAGSVLNAATIMSNHGHESSTVIDQMRYSNHMRRHHARYGSYFNRANKRCGKVAQDRPYTTLIADPHHHMLCILYIHANPHRAGIGDAENYAYSTHRLYAYGKRSLWMRNIVFPKWYLMLGKTDRERQKNYRKLFAWYLKATGLVKQSFLKKRFFGPADWMLNHERQVSEWRKSSRAAPS